MIKRRMRVMSLRKLYNLIIIFCFSVSTASAAATNLLNEKELKIIDFINDKNTQAEYKLLNRLVDINSSTDNISGVRQVGEIVKQQLQDLGFKTYWVALPKNLQRAPTLVAEHHGGKGKRILLIAHLDTVFPKNHSFQKMRKQDDTFIGPGVIDDKGGIVVMLYALKALKAAHVLDNANITIAITGDEENAGRPIAQSRKKLFEIAAETDVALDFEPSTETDAVTLSRRGISTWKMETTGNEAHSSRIFQSEIGAGAAFEMTRILNAMYEQVHGEQTLTFNVGLMMAGTDITLSKDATKGAIFGKNNVVPQIGMASGDFRYLTLDEKARLIKTMNTILQEHLPQTTATLTIQDAMPPMLPTENNTKLLDQYSKASQDLGYGSVHGAPATLRGAADISHIAHIVPANLGGLGPVGSNEHTENETLFLSSLTLQTARAALLIYRLSIN